MDAEVSKVDKKVHFRDWPSREFIFTYKRRRLQQWPPQAQARAQPEPQQRPTPQAQARAQPKPQLRPPPQAQAQARWKPQPWSEPKHKARDRQAQERKDIFWRSRNTYKRRRLQQQEQQPPPQAQARAQPKPQQQPAPQEKARAQPKPQLWPQPQAQAQARSEAQPRSEPKHKARDVQAQERKDIFWRSRNTYKRRRPQQQEQQPPPHAQARAQPEPHQQPTPQEQARAQPKPQLRPQPQAQAQARSEAQPRSEPKHKARDVQAQERKNIFWRSRNTYKRQQLQQQEQQLPPHAQARAQSELQQQLTPQEQARAQLKPQLWLQPQAQAQARSEAQPRSEPKHKAIDVQAQEMKDIFWRSRDMGWKYGIMIDENRQHWKCMYCGLIRYGGGVSRLKRHLAGDLDVKMCPKVPANVAEEIRVHLRKKRERRRKRAAQNASNDVNIKSDDGIVEKDLLPADLEVPAETDTNILEEVTNQKSMVHQDPTCSRVPLLRTRDVGWEHAVDLDGNKRRWQCKFCSLSRSGGVTTLKAHLIDESCPHVPKEISEKVSNFIQEKRATRLVLSNFAYTVDDDRVSDSQIHEHEQGTAQYENDRQPSRKATHKCAIDEVAKTSSKCTAESKAQLIEHCDQPEEQRAMDHVRMHQVTSNKHQISNKSTKNSKNTKTLEPHWKRGFSTRKHTVIVNASARHWRCRYCGMDGYDKTFRLPYHLAGAFSQPQCPRVPKEVFAEARYYVGTKKSLKRVKSGPQIPSGLHIVGQSGAELQSTSNQLGPSHLEIRKDATKKILNQIISKSEQKSRSESFDRNGGCSFKSSQLDQEHYTTTMHVSNSSQNFNCDNSKSGACNTFSNPSQESVNPPVYQEKKREDTGVSPLMFLEKQRDNSSASHQVPHEQQREEAARPSEPGCLQGQMMQWLLQHKQTMEEGPQESRLLRDTNKSGKQISDYWTDWRNVLDGLMHSSDVKEGAGIWSCIRDALLYGCAQFGTVPDTMELADGTVKANTAMCQNVLMDILRSEDFVLLCSVLCRSVHQDGARTRYFDFGVIDSRMKNGNYGHEPRLFLHDLKLIWEDLKMAGRNIVELANRLSSLTEAFCGNLVGREKESGDSELKGAVVSSSKPTNFVESNALVISTSQGDNELHQSYRVDLDQSDPVEVSDIQNGSSCNQCGKEAKGGNVLKCTKCMLSCHISCTEPPFPSISTESWYCRNCSMEKSIEGDVVLAHCRPLVYYQSNLLHENCAACDRLKVCRSPKCEDTPNDNSRAMVVYSVGSVEGSYLPDINTVASCKICGNPEEEDKRFLICGHVHCRYKYYHIRCLKSNQIASDLQRNKPCWYCPSCLCRVCLSDKDDDLTVLCDGCDEAYHLYCVRPRRTSVPKQWYCSSCSIKRAKGGMRRYERRKMKLHRKVHTRLQRRKYDGVDLLLSAADMLSADEQLVSCKS